MKKSELLQLAIDKHLVMRWEDRLKFSSKSRYLCNAVDLAYYAYQHCGATFELQEGTRAVIRASINNEDSFVNYLRSNGAAIGYTSLSFPKEQFEFIQFLRKKHAEFLIQQLQAKGE